MWTVLSTVMNQASKKKKNTHKVFGPFHAYFQQSQRLNASLTATTQGISEHVICVQHHYTSVQNPNSSWKTTHQLKISLCLWTCLYISELTGDLQLHSCSDPRDQTQWGSNHTSAGPRFSGASFHSLQTGIPGDPLRSRQHS